TSQKVSVKSNGVCAIEQKLAYVRSVSASSSAGTIVKLICLVWSAMPGSLILPHDPHDDALYLYLVRIDKDRLHGGVGRLQADLAAGVAIELLQRHVGPAHQRDHHLPVVGRLAVLHDDEVAVADLLVDHRVAADAQHVGVTLADQVFGDGDGLVR